MNDQSSKHTFDDDIGENKRLKISTISKDKIKKVTTFQDFYEDIFLEIFQYLRPVDLLYSFDGLYPELDTLVAPYTHTLDFRLISKSYFHCLTETLLPCLTNNLRVLRLSNSYTFNQISEILSKLDWSRINQIESLTFDSIKTDELLKYILDIHPLLNHLWRLSLTFDEDNIYADKLFLDHILIPTNGFQSLTSCCINGLIFNLNKFIPQKFNENLHELKLTLANINDLIILYRILPCLEILTCTILDGICNENLDKIPSINSLTRLTLIIEKPIEFKTLQKVLMPQIKLTYLTLKVIIHNENQEIGGLVLEKFFRTFSNLTELHFYLRHLFNNNTIQTPDYLYLYSFTSWFWRSRSIQVFTHFIQQPKQRYIYTLPFAFDTFDIIGDIPMFFLQNYSYHFVNVRHLTLSSISNLDDKCYSNIILKYFPNIRTIKLVDQSSSTTIINTFKKYQWILRRSQSTDDYPCVYILNGRKSTHLYFRTLDIVDEDQRLFANNSKRVRQLTIYEMTEQQSVSLTYFFSRIHVLTLYVNTLEWFSSSNQWFYYLLTNMTLLFSLTVYYPKDINDDKIRDLLVNTLLTLKKHFFIKCTDGTLNIWF